MIRETVVLIVELIALFFGIAFAIQLFQRRVGAGRLQAWMGGTPVVAALKGIAIGFATPFCTFSAIPMLIGFRQAGVRTAGYVAFIVAAPVLDPVLFGALVLIAGLSAAVTYAVVAFTAAMTLALIADRVGIDSFLKPLASSPVEPARRAFVAEQSSPTSTLAIKHDGRPALDCVRQGCSGPVPEETWAGWRSEARTAARSAAKLIRSVAVVLTIGVLVGIAIETFISPQTAATLTGDNSILSIPIAAILGTPLYFSTALFVPIAEALTATGVGIGAIVALTISGAGASVPEFILLTKFAQTKLLTVFFSSILIIAVIGGLLSQVIAG